MFKDFYKTVVVEKPEVTAVVPRGKVEFVLELRELGAVDEVEIDEDREADGDKRIPVLFNEIH